MTTVVVVGGGLVGALVAKKLAAHAALDVLLLDTRDHTLFKVASLRAAVLGGQHARDAAMPRTKMTEGAAPDRRVRVRVGKVASVTERAVMMDDGEEIPFDYCVAATGATNNSPGEPPQDLSTRDQVVAYFDSVSAAVREAARITIVGGGVVGVELAGEIKARFSAKEVAIVHAGDELLSSSHGITTSHFRASVLSSVRKLGVQVHLGRRVALDKARDSAETVVPGKQTLVLDNGDQLETDLLFVCIGTTPNNSMYPPAWLAPDSGLLRVRHTMQLQDHDHIFAVGDIADVAPEKMFRYGVVQADIVVANIVTLSRSGSTALRRYRDPVAIMMVPLGPKGGVSIVGRWLTFGDWFTRFKSKTLFVPRFQKDLA
ncbi:Apoptosis-inducing factor homolog A [Durusdinium trenchii]|uniref:Apoptosis-inducing factor homolog A n=1 Tax=Durusdinium trenchii TaxID=1381693 RepID=A0ABP0II37_9DINO